MLKEFKEFAVKGNVLDLAIAVILGTAFSPIVNSLVNDIIMPPIGMVLSRVDFKDLYVSLSRDHYPSLAAAKTAGVPVIAYGNFLNTVINFLIVAFAMFLIVRQANRLQRPKPVAAPTTKECAFCAQQIPLKAIRCPQCTSQLAPA
jgi:large conductance mechanosensitive channel